MTMQLEINNHAFGIRFAIDELLEGLTSSELIELNKAITEELTKRGY